MNFDYSKLSGKIREVSGTQDQFAKVMGMGRVSLNERMNNKKDWKQSEIKRAANILGFSQEEIVDYFFTEKVQKNELN